MPTTLDIPLIAVQTAAVTAAYPQFNQVPQPIRAHGLPNLCPGQARPLDRRLLAAEPVRVLLRKVREAAARATGRPGAEVTR